MAVLPISRLWPLGVNILTIQSATPLYLIDYIFLVHS